MQKRVISSAIARNGARIAVVGRKNSELSGLEYGVVYSGGEIWIAKGFAGLMRAKAMALTLFNNPSFI